MPERLNEPPLNATPRTAPPLTVAALSESQLLERIFPRLHYGQEHNPSLILGPGDDAAIVAAPDGRTVLSIDTQVADQDFRLEWNNGYRTTGYDVGWKAAAQNLSDINAMGARATSLVVLARGSLPRGRRQLRGRRRPSEHGPRPRPSPPRAGAAREEAPDARRLRDPAT